MQKLRIPFRKAMMLCGYKNQKYRDYWGYAHYGIDISTIQGGAGDDDTVYASGTGKVVAAGKDSKLGGAICVQYDDVYNHKTGETVSVVARYMHLKSVSVKTGDTVTLDTPLGVEGKEGTGDYHLHLEFDTDLNYPQWTPQVSSGLSFWVRGVDSTVNPSYLLHQDADHELVEPTYNPEWLNSEDFSIPVVEPDTPANSTIKWDDLRGMLEANGIETIEL